MQGGLAPASPWLITRLNTACAAPLTRLHEVTEAASSERSACRTTETTMNFA